MLHRQLKLLFNFSVRVRYAPSPTGPMHLGAVRTALFNYLFAKHHNGKFILRIEDTDIERNVKGSQKDILDTLDWLGIVPDQSIRVGGPYGPYIQSQRLNIYKQIQKDLLRNNYAYPCFCETATGGKKDKEKKDENMAQKGYDGKCRKLSMQEIKNRIKAGQRYAIRIKSDIAKFRTSTFNDYIHGIISSTPFDDYILMKKNGYPTYHFANVVDDWKMQITHVIRGQQWLTNTPKHLYLYNVLGAKPPVFAHLPLIMTNDGKKLSKRDPTSPIANLKAKGYQSQAIVNYAGLMGLNLKQSGPSSQQLAQKNEEAKQENMKQKAKKDEQINEYYSLNELCQIFELEKIKNSPVKSDVKKLNFFNRFYIRKKWKQQDHQFLQQLFNTFRSVFHLKQGTREHSQQFLKDVVDCISERLNNLDDIKQYAYFFQQPNFASETAKKDIRKVFGPNATLQPCQSSPFFILKNGTAQKIEKSKKILHNLTLIFKQIISPQEFSYIKIAETVSKFVYDNRNDLENQDVYHLLRLAVTGMKSGVNIIKTCYILGQDKVVSDLENFSKMVVGKSQNSQ